MQRGHGLILVRQLSWVAQVEGQQRLDLKGLSSEVHAPPPPRTAPDPQRLPYQIILYTTRQMSRMILCIPLHANILRSESPSLPNPTYPWRQANFSESVLTTKHSC